MVRGAATTLRALKERCSQLEEESRNLAEQARERIRLSEEALAEANSRVFAAEARAELREDQLATLIRTVQLEFVETFTAEALPSRAFVHPVENWLHSFSEEGLETHFPDSEARPVTVGSSPAERRTPEL